MFRNISRIPFSSTSFTKNAQRSSQYSTTTALAMARKAGVSSPEELKDFVAKAGERLLVVDVRNPDASVEPGDQKSIVVAALPSESNRPQAVSLIYDRESKSMALPEVDSDTPIITHCGGGGRGQKAKDFLEANGFTNVLNGGGPKETECWNEFGSK
jgi:rhodanese-related sulfurtransferase